MKFEDARVGMVVENSRGRLGIIFHIAKKPIVEISVAYVGLKFPVHYIDTMIGRSDFKRVKLIHEFEGQTMNELQLKKARIAYFMGWRVKEPEFIGRGFVLLDPNGRIRHFPINRESAYIQMASKITLQWNCLIPVLQKLYADYLVFGYEPFKSTPKEIFEKIHRDVMRCLHESDLPKILQ